MKNYGINGMNGISYSLLIFWIFQSKVHSQLSLKIIKLNCSESLFFIKFIFVIKKL